MTWAVELDPAAARELKTLYKKHHGLIPRWVDIKETLKRDPLEESHNFEPLKGNYSGFFSRRLSQKDRVIYRVDGKQVLVFVIQILGHYDD